MANWTTNVFVNSLLVGSKVTNTTINYFLDPSGGAWTASEVASAQAAFQSWMNVANIAFVQVNTAATAHFVETKSTSAVLGGGTLADHTVPADGYASPTIIDVNLLATDPLVGRYATDAVGWDDGGLTVGGDAHQTLIHEIGHGLGLDHSHDGGGNGLVDPHIFPGVTPGTNVTGEQDPGSNGLNDNLYTVMSYYKGPRNRDNTLEPNSNNFGNAGTPMAFDIAAIQFLYGANTTQAAGNDTYIMPDAAAAGTFWSGIWDTGGIDTIVYNGALNSTIDLRSATLLDAPGGGGYVSQAAGVFGGYTIAADFTNVLADVNGETGVIIENASGGTGADLITGNNVGNVLRGNAGGDTISGSGGRDWINGGTGNDGLTGGADGDLFAFNGAISNVGDVINDYVAGSDILYFGNAAAIATVAINGANVTVNGVTVTGGAAADITVITQASGALLIGGETVDLIANFQSSNNLAATGPHTRTLYDTNTDQAWTSDSFIYAIQGLDLRIIRNDDNSSLHINFDQTNGNGWSQIADTYNTTNQLTNKVTTLDTNAFFSTFFDVAGTQAWQTSTTGKTAANLTDYQDITYNDNTRIFTDYDQAGAIPWTTALTNFNAAAQQVFRRVTYDDNRVEVTFQDFASNQIWSSKIDTYTDGTNRDFVNFYNDDNSRKTTDFDQLAGELWSAKEINYNPANQALSINTVYDNATRILKSFDPAMANNTQEVTVGYDALGRADYINTLYDDNTRIARDYDQADTFAWAEHVMVYDAGGALINDYFI